jgi:sulfur carrier protein
MRIEIKVNGATQEIASATSLHQLLQDLKLGGGKIAIEVNGEIIPRSQFLETMLQANDKLEIVQAIGGG